MSQNSIVIPTTPPLPGTDLVNDINAALDTLNTSWFGSSAPGTPEQGQRWWDSSVSNTMNDKAYDGASWVSRGTIDTVAHQYNGAMASLALSGSRSAAAWAHAGPGLNVVAATYTDTSSSGAVSGVTAIHSINVPTLAASSVSTYANAATLYIDGPPTAGTNATLTKSWALYINSGIVASLGAMGIGTTSSIGTSSTLRVNIAQAQLGATYTQILADGAHTLSGTNTSVYRGVSSDPSINQNGNNQTTSLTSGGGVQAYYANPVASGATGTVTSITGFVADVRNTGAGVLTNGVGFLAVDVTNSGGGTLSNAYGFYTSDITSASTLNVGFRGGLTAGSGKWNLYLDGSAPSSIVGGIVCSSVAGSAAVTTNGQAALIQTLGTTSSSATISATRYGTGATNNSELDLCRVNSASIGAVTAVTTGMDLGAVVGCGSDGTSAGVASVRIRMQVDNASGATVGTGVIPGLYTVYTANNAGALTEAMRVDYLQNILLGYNGTTGVKATSATSGFPQMPSCAGAATGTPTVSYTGMCQFIYDTTNNHFYVYNRVAGAWKSVLLS